MRSAAKCSGLGSFGDGSGRAMDYSAAMDDAAIDVLLIEWEKGQPAHERADPMWGLVVYRLARYALDASRRYAGALQRSGKPSCVDQLTRAVASISANVSEGYSRLTPADRARYYAYALGSTREAISWYASLRDALGDDTTNDRILVLSSLRRLLFGTLKSNQLSSHRSRFSP